MDTWLDEYNCDGVRIDSAHSMPPDFVRRVTNRARQFGNDKFVVVEHSPEGGHVPGELGADSCWLFSNSDNCAGMTNHWKGNMERLEQVAKGPGGYHNNHAFVKFPMGSHDTIGKRPGHTHDLGHWASRFGGRGEWRARASMRLWWGIAAAGVGIPMLFMGTETHQVRIARFPNPTHFLPIVQSNYCLLHTSKVDCLPIHGTCTLKTDTFF